LWQTQGVALAIKFWQKTEKQHLFSPNPFPPMVWTRIFECVILVVGLFFRVWMDLNSDGARTKAIPTEMRKRILDDCDGGMTENAAAEQWKVGRSTIMA
jgi:hypothetical protein